MGAAEGRRKRGAGTPTWDDNPVFPASGTLRPLEPLGFGLPLYAVGSRLGHGSTPHGCLIVYRRGSELSPPQGVGRVGLAPSRGFPGFGIRGSISVQQLNRAGFGGHLFIGSRDSLSGSTVLIILEI